MDRIVDIKVGGYHISKDNKNAGVVGEGNVSNLRIAFDKSWDEYAKTITFWDAQGNNPVKRLIGLDLLEDKTKNTRVFLVPIPKEPLAVAGELTFVIDGYYEKKINDEVVERKKQRSVSGKLVVIYSPYEENAEEPTDPMPEIYVQLQTEIEKLGVDIQNALIATNEIKNMSVSAQGLLPEEVPFVTKTEENGLHLTFGIPAGEKGNDGKDGEKGEKGDTPSVVLMYDEKTGDLYYDSDGILIDKEYVASQNFATEEYVDLQVDNIRTEIENKPNRDEIVDIVLEALPNGDEVSY